ncbi:MAG: CsgG/HfaB family protein [Planctomycetota bacterium]
MIRPMTTLIFCVAVGLPLALRAQEITDAQKLAELKALKVDGHATWTDPQPNMELKFELSVTGSKAIVDNANAVIAVLPLDIKYTPPMLPPGADEPMRQQMATQAKGQNDMFAQMLQDVFRDKFLKLGYQVVEREEIQKVMQEQNLSMTDLVEREKKIQVGKLLAAKFLFTHELQTVCFVNFQTGAMESTYSYSGKFIDAETGRVRATVQYIISSKGKVG